MDLSVTMGSSDELTQPSFVVAVVQKIAEIKGLSLDFVRSQILSNFQKFTLHSEA